jgi:hypothetical protein
MRQWFFALVVWRTNGEHAKPRSWTNPVNARDRDYGFNPCSAETGSVRWREARSREGKHQMTCVDVVIQTNEAHINLLSEPPPKEPLKLAEDIVVKKLDNKIANIVFGFGQPQGHKIRPPTVQCAQMYAFVRSVQEPASISEWDSDTRLQTVVALSRLVHPTSISFRHAARIRYNDDGSIKHAYPAVIFGVDPDPWLWEPNARNWLIAREFEQLRTLLEGKSISTLPARLSRALWYHEYASRTYYGHVRWLFVCTAIEALVNTSVGNVAKQFRERLHKMALSVNTEISEDEAALAYRLRSQLSHGRAAQSVTEPEKQTCMKLEYVLRATLLTAILDDAFKSTFTSDAAIRARWPVFVTMKDGSNLSI